SAENLLSFSGSSYTDIATEILGLFCSDTFKFEELKEITRQAYSKFRHKAVAPLVQIDDGLWLLELFHGPTMAFKDLALQVVSLMFDSVLARSGKRLTIIGATSGDTGSAAMEACRDREP